MNLPSNIFVRQLGKEVVKGTINYLYDAGGNKLEKEVIDGNTFVSKKTSYIGGFIYENDIMQFFGQEEGRIRPKIVTGLPL